MSVEQSSRFTRSQSLSETVTSSEDEKRPTHKLSINENTCRPNLQRITSNLDIRHSVPFLDFKLCSLTKMNRITSGSLEGVQGIVNQTDNGNVCHSFANAQVSDGIQLVNKTPNDSANHENFIKLTEDKNEAKFQKMLDSKSGAHSVLTDTHGIGCEIVPEYLKANKIDMLTTYLNMKYMEVILSSKAIIDHNDECDDFQSLLKYIVVGLQPKRNRQRCISQGPTVVLRDETIHFPYDNKYRRAILNVEIQPNIDALDLPVPIKLVKANTFYDKNSRPYSSRGTEDFDHRTILTTQNTYNNTGQRHLRSNYYRPTSTRARSRAIMYEPVALKEYLTRPLMYRSIGNLYDLSFKQTNVRHISGSTANLLHTPFRHYLQASGSRWNEVAKKMSCKTRIAAPNDDKWSITATEVINGKPNGAPIENRRHLTTTEVAIENKYFAPMDNTWNSTTSEIVNENEHVPMDSKWNSITSDVVTVTDKRNVAPVDNRWNATTRDIFSDNGNVLMDSKWNSITSEIVTEKRNVAPVNNRWNTTEVGTEKRKAAPVENRWNTTTTEVVTEKRNVVPVDNIWNTTTIDVFTEKQNFAPIDNKLIAPSTEVATKQRNIIPLDNLNTSMTEIVIERRDIAPVYSRINSTTVETARDETDGSLKQTDCGSHSVDSKTNVIDNLNYMRRTQSTNKTKYSHTFDSLIVCNFDSKNVFNTPSHLSSKERNGFTSDMTHEGLSDFKCAPINICGDIENPAKLARRKSEDIRSHFGVHPKTGTLHVVDVDSFNGKESNKVFLDLPQNNSAFPPIHKASSFPELSDSNNNFSTNSDRSRSTGNVGRVECLRPKTASTDSISYVFVSRARSLNSMPSGTDKGKLLRPKSDPGWESSNDFESCNEHSFTERKDASERQVQTSDSFENVYWYEIDENKISSESDLEESRVKTNAFRIKSETKKHQLRQRHNRPQRPQSRITITSPRGSTFAANHSAKFLPEIYREQRPTDTPPISQDFSKIKDVIVILNKSRDGKSTDSLCVAEDELIKSAVSAYLSDIEATCSSYAKDQKHIRNTDMSSNRSDTPKSQAKRNIKIIFDCADEPRFKKDSKETRFFSGQRQKSQEWRQGKSEMSSVHAKNLSEGNASGIRNNGLDKIITLKDIDGSLRSFIISHQWDRVQDAIRIYLKEEVAKSPATTRKATISRFKKCAEPLSIDFLAGMQIEFDERQKTNSDRIHETNFISDDLHSVDNDNELERLRRERHEVLGLLSKDHKSSQMQVELAEAELNYINGQTDTLLNNFEGRQLPSANKRSKVVTAADEIEFHLNVENKNYFHGHTFAKDFGVNDFSFSSYDSNSKYRGKSPNAEGNINHGLSVRHISQLIKDGKLNDDATTSKCSTCALKPCNWSSSNPMISRRTSCDLSSPAAFSKHNDANTTQSHFISDCLWSTHLQKQKSLCPDCPICLLKKQLSQSSSDLLGVMNLKIPLEQSIKTPSDDVFRSNNWQVNCPKGCSLTNSWLLQKLTPHLTNGGIRENILSSPSSTYQAQILHQFSKANGICEDLSYRPSYESPLLIEPKLH